MKGHNVNNSTCGFNLDLLGYLYNEIAAGEKLNVEQHLASCELCSNEFAAISSAKLSVSEWHLQEFVGLQTPTVKFEPETHNSPASIWSAWTILGRLRFSAPIFAAAAVLVIFGAILFLGSTNDEIDRASETVSPVATPSAEDKHTALPESYSEPNRVTVSTNGNEVAIVPATPSLRAAPTRSLSSRMVVGAASDRPNRSSNVRYQRTMPLDRSVAKGEPSTPNLSGYEEKEDDTLRLEDIFSEIDAS